MKKINRYHFDDILNYSKDAVNFIENITYEEFTKDKKTLFAVIRAIEVVGEASNRVSEEIKEKYPNIPWIEMRGLRNRIVHNYDDIDYQILWNVIKNELPVLINKIEEIIDEIE